MHHHFVGPLSLALLLALAATSVQAADLQLSGSAGLVSDYRFRGISQTNNGVAVQGGLTLDHVSGAYGGVWASNLAGWGDVGGSGVELDLFGGYAFPVGGGTLDLGGTVHFYPGGAAKSAFVEPRARLSGTIGPVGLVAGLAYAWNQSALGNWSNHPDSRPGARGDNLYLWGDATSGIPGTPFSIRAHIGHSDGNPGLGPNGTSLAPTGRYWDWLVGIDYVIGPVTLGVAYVDTDINPNSGDFARLQPNFSQGQRPGGDPVSSARAVFSVTASF